MRKSKRALGLLLPSPRFFQGKPRGRGFTDSSSIISSVSFAPGEFISESVFSAPAMSGSSRSPMSFFAREDSASPGSVLIPRSETGPSAGKASVPRAASTASNQSRQQSFFLHSTNTQSSPCAGYHLPGAQRAVVLPIGNARVFFGKAS